MSDVEKYGLFAVVFVGGLLLLIAVQGGFGDEGEAVVVSPVVIGVAPTAGADEPALKPGSQLARLKAADSQPPASGPRTVRIQSYLREGPFEYDALPGPYPGARSVRPGAVLEPVVTRAKPPASARWTPISYTVRAGDTLTEISQLVLGTSQRAKEIFAANRDQLKSMDDLRIGQVLVMPGAPKRSARDLRSDKAAAAKALAQPTKKPAASSGRTHTVQSGDTLSEISMSYLGTSRRAQEIFLANQDVLKSPDALAVGQVLRIP